MLYRQLNTYYHYKADIRKPIFRELTAVVLLTQSTWWHWRGERSQGALRRLAHTDTTTYYRWLWFIVDHLTWPSRPCVTSQAVVPWTQWAHCTVLVLRAMHSGVCQRWRGVRHCPFTTRDQPTRPHLSDSLPAGQHCTAVTSYNFVYRPFCISFVVSYSRRWNITAVLSVCVVSSPSCCFSASTRVQKKTSQCTGIKLNTQIMGSQTLRANCSMSY